MFWATRPRPAAINDASTELMEFYRHVAEGRPAFHEALRALAYDWTLLNTLADTHLSPVADQYVRDRGVTTPPTKAADQAITTLLSAFLAERRAHFVQDEGLTRQTRRAMVSKLDRMVKIEARKGPMPPGDVFDNLHGALKAGLYFQLRAQYNQEVVGAPSLNPTQAAIFFFIRETCYAAMFRYSKAGTFNVPFGGISYARKSLICKVARLTSPEIRAHLQDAELHCGDFQTFLDRTSPTADDFIFVDPPYDDGFSTYVDNTFGPADQRRLAEAMDHLASRSKIMLVVKSTPLIEELYPRERWKVHGYDKRYLWTIKERNERDVTHLMIRNY